MRKIYPRGERSFFTSRISLLKTPAVQIYLWPTQPDSSKTLPRTPAARIYVWPTKQIDLYSDSLSLGEMRKIFPRGMQPFFTGNSFYFL